MTESLIVPTTDWEQTFTLGKSVGQLLQTGLILTLTGDLGSGKTVFVQGLARGIGVPDHYYITSPTYTLINDYPGRLPLYHIDLYRLTTMTDITDIGLEDILSGKGVVAIEWADRLQKDDLGEHLDVHVQITDEGTRQIRITLYGRTHKNLLKELEKKIRER